MLKRYILFLKKTPLITAILAIVYAMLCLKTIRTETFFQGFVLRTLLCGAMAFFLYQISGDKTLAASYDSTWYVIKVGMGFWVLALPMGLLGLFSSAGYPVHDNIPVQTISVFLMFLFVGLFEEMAFRAVINDAVIYEFRDKKYVFVLSALMSSLAFGVAHIIGADLSGPLAIVQAVGKIVQTAVFGLAILFLYWKTRNIWACGIIHGIYDFLLSLCDCFFDVPGKKISYVVSGEAGKYTVIIYAVITAIELFIFWMIYRKIGKKIDYRKIREEW
ncbi:MAG: CPBP family intramembrane metalloprotease [Erysipelotrichaceae bacterium]|nr:CPBP family intramembrane metalloprotease [Erysipelotrichaceae bacterium]MBQ1482757.1 CPBP family intramembrane metalloprotease [Erysipelotrichaceae bacterium]